jgi:hypothetical protein
MQTQGFFDWLGQAVGTVIRFIVEVLSGFFDLIGNAGQHFLGGLARALGMETSLLGMIALVIGLLFLAAAIRAFFRRKLVAGIVWLVLALWLLSLIIH